MVRMPKLKVNNVGDFKDGSGLWVRSYSPEPYLEHHTRAGVLWVNVNTRCKIDGSFQTKHPTYIGVTNGFSDFQEFAEWCQQQYGYLHKEENGYFWQLDKDLKVFGNRVYNPESCLFVPSQANKLLISSVATRGKHPLGVYWHNERRKFASIVSTNGRQKWQGSFDCPMEAHQAWQRYKIDVIRRIITEDEEIINHLELVPILLAQAQRIEDDLNNGRETM